MTATPLGLRIAAALRGPAVALALLAAGAAMAQAPVYSVTQPDAITGDNPTQNFSVPGVNCTGCRLPDANGATPVDNYRQDIYERPTGSGSSASVYYAALDITSGQVGYDATWVYYRINLYGIDTASKWLPYYYAFEINFDSDARGDLFVRVEDPSGKVGGTWGTSGVVAFWDQNNNHGAANPGLPDYNGGNDGYENLVFDQGSNNRPGSPGGNTAVVARVVGTASAPAVELAVRRVFLDNLNGGPIVNASFRPYTAKGGGTTAANNLPLHDKYGRQSGGSPFPWLALTGAPAICPNTLTAENALTPAQQAALASGTNVNTGIDNPCYPSGGNIVEMDNAGTISDLVSGPPLINFLVDISGRVFEDVNYGGGAGRPCGAVTGSPTCALTASAVGRNGARVELFTVSGTTATFAAATTTNANGDYTFASRSGNASYLVRVVNGTATSSRTGSTSGLLPVQTFRTNGLTGNVGTADANRVGGERPDLADGGEGGSGDTINTTTGAATGLATGNQAQSISVFTAGIQTVTGIDFGFNFSTVVNVNDVGQGSLRQFIVNSNTLGGEGAMAQAGSRSSGLTGATEALPAGKETSIFMIPDGTARPGLRAGLANQLTAGVAQIQPATALPAISGPHTVTDGGTQTFNVGNTNTGVLGTGGTVGVDALPLPTVQRPEVFIRGLNGLPVGISVQANDVWLRGLAISGFRAGGSIDVQSNVLLGNDVSGALIEQNVLGASATAFSDPGSSTRSGGHNIRSLGADGGTVRHNLIGFATGGGVRLIDGSNGWTITGNEVRGNGIGNLEFDGIDVGSGSGSATVTGNLVTANQGVGIDMGGGTGGNTVANNTVSGNGTGTGSQVETAGIRVFGSASVIDRNIVNANTGTGVQVTAAANGNRITRNSIFANGTIGTPVSGQIGIDLQSAAENAKTGTTPYVTLNDGGDGDSGGNNLLNYPVITSATMSGGNLTLVGFARPGSAIELFVAAPDPSGFGEGQTYLVTLTEGSGADLDTGTSTYGPGPVNGIAQGADTTNRFRFTIPAPGGVALGTVLTATATVGNDTSEFSGLATVTTSSVPLTHVKSMQVVSDPYNGAVNPKAIPGAVVQYTLLIANPGAGSIDNDSIAVIDPIPANTRLYVGDIAGAGSGPVAFVNGTPSSGLTWNYTSLASGTDDLEFSNDSGATWTHVPATDGNQCDTSGTTHVRMRPKGTMAGNSGSGGPSFELRFRVCIK